MLPPDLGFNAIFKRALERSWSVKWPYSCWGWDDMLGHDEHGFFLYTSPTTLFHGLRAGVDMLLQEDLEAVFTRHARHAESPRRAERALNLESQCDNDREHLNSLPAVRLRDGHDADHFRESVLDRFNMSLGSGLTKLRGRVLRIGHLASFHDRSLADMLSSVEMGLGLAAVLHRKK